MVILTVVINMNGIIKQIKKDFYNNPDLKIKEFNVGLLKRVYVIFLETVSDATKINEYIDKNLINYKNNRNINSNIPGPNALLITVNEIEFYLTNGFAVVISSGSILAVEARSDLNRSITNSSREPALLGPIDAFNENININIGLVKRRIKTKNFKSEELFLGRLTKTKISITYIDTIAEYELVETIKKKLAHIDIDGIFDAGTIINYIESENKTVFPTIKRTEKPDVVANYLLEGKIAIFIDTSPFAIIIPTFLVDFINPISDNYVKSINVAFIKVLRLMSFMLSIITPALFIAIINYNQETIPSSLLINFSTQRAGVPFPSIVELLILLIICDVLRESDLRFPSNFGSAISILGALIIGEAAVSAGLVSSIMIIITALTLISSLIFTELEIGNALRYYRYLFLFFAALFGLYGLFIAGMILFINLISTKSVNAPYFAPIAPFNKNYFFKTIFKGRDRRNLKRSTLITKKNMTRGNTP